MSIDTVLTDAEIESVAEHVYEAFRLGKYGEQEYLPIWHDLETKPLDVPEVRATVAAVERILAGRQEAAVNVLRTLLVSALPEPTPEPIDAGSEQ